MGLGVERSAAVPAAGVVVGDGNAGGGAVEDGGAPAAVAVAAAAVADAPAAAGGELEVPPGARTGAAENAFIRGAGTLTGEEGAAVAVPTSVSARATGAAHKVRGWLSLSLYGFVL